MLFDPVLVEGKEARVKAKMPVPRPVAMGILPTPSVEFELAWWAAWRANSSNSSSGSGSGNGIVSAAAAGPNASSSAAAASYFAALAQAADDAATAAAAKEEAGGGAALPAPTPLEAAEPEPAVAAAQDKKDPPSNSAPPEQTIHPASAGLGSAAWEGARTRGCYEGVPGPTRRLRVYCFRSPPGEVEGWKPKVKARKKKKTTPERNGGQQGEGGNEGAERESGGGDVGGSGVQAGGPGEDGMKKEARVLEGAEEVQAEGEGGERTGREEKDDGEEEEEEEEEHEVGEGRGLDAGSKWTGGCEGRLASDVCSP